MRRLIASLVLSMPLLAAGQTLDGVPATQVDHLAPYRILQPARSGVLVPLWRAADGRMLALVGGRDGVSERDETGSPVDFRVVDITDGFSAGLRYDIGPHVATHARLSQRSLLAAPVAGCTPSEGIGCADAGTLSSARLLSSEFGASYNWRGYSLGVALDTTKPGGASPLLPRVLPNGPATASGLPLSSLDSSTSFSANGRVALGGQSGIDVGASVGRIRLLPGNLLGIDALGQKSLSLGVDSGPLSGRITGRVVQPEAGRSPLGPDHRWTSIDLGVTWRLPWQGELRFGAQNVWSSGQAPVPANGPEPDQSRIPYVQYHQDL